MAAMLVFLVTLITYAPLILDLGFYQDDWYLLWSAEARGVQSILSLFKIDRPFMGMVNYVDYLIFADNLVLWQIYSLYRYQA